MNHLILASLFALVPCLRALAITYGPYQLPPGYSLLGSQFVNPSDMIGDYLAPNSFDKIILLSSGGSCEQFSYDPDEVAWVPGNPLGPTLNLGTAFFFQNASASRTLFRTIASNPAQPGTTLTLTANHYYMLSSWTPTVDPYSYPYLVGGSVGVPLPHSRTFVWLWNPTAAGFDVVHRYTGSNWKKLTFPSTITAGAAPAIPSWQGALVAWFSADPAPVLQAVQVSPGSCPPQVTLTLTFSAPVDPITAALPNNYQILKGCFPNDNGGTITSVSLPAPTFDNCSSISVTTVTLAVTLQTEPSCHNYLVSAPHITSMGGTASAGTVSVIPYSPCNSPGNDLPINATAVTSGTPVNGSLTCANATPYGVVSQFPTGAGPNAQDVWYSFTPAVSGSAAIDTCQAVTCMSDTVLAVYQGNPATLLYPIPVPAATPGAWFNDNGGAGCNPRSKMTFFAPACGTCYIRVSGHGTGSLPGDFKLNLAFTPQSPLPNDLCSAAKKVSPNSSTRFDNLTATGTGGIDHDEWFYFTVPAGGGATTVDTCSPNLNFNSAIEVYGPVSSCSSLGPVIASDAGAGSCGPMGSTVTFNAVAGNYYVRVGGHNSAPSQGCGFLRVSCAIPPVGTPAPSSGGCTYNSYTILGSPNNTPWSWSLTAPPPCALNQTDDVTPGVPSGGAYDIALAFATSINKPAHSPISAMAIMDANNPQRATLKICVPCNVNPTVGTILALKVGALGSPNCWVNYDAGWSTGTGFLPCNFNPDIFQIGDAEAVGVDCNANGQADYIDILDGTSVDADGDGIPDECQACVAAAIDVGPDSVIGHLGGSATLAVHAVGTAPFIYQWRKDGVLLSGQTNATLVLMDLPLGAAGLYDVSVTNACGDVTSPSAALAVDPTPVLNVARVGSDVVLSWSDSDYQLQASTVLSNSAAWTDLPGSSPVTLPINTQARFFRLQQQP